MPKRGICSGFEIKKTVSGLISEKMPGREGI